MRSSRSAVAHKERAADDGDCQHRSHSTGPGEEAARAARVEACGHCWRFAEKPLPSALHALFSRHACGLLCWQVVCFVRRQEQSPMVLLKMLVKLLAYNGDSGSIRLVEYRR